MPDYFERIMKIAFALGYKNTHSFATKGLGWPRSDKLRRLEKGERPSVDILESITKNFPNVNLDWIFTGKGAKFKDEKQTLIDLNKIVDSELELALLLGALNKDHKNLLKKPIYMEFIERVSIENKNTKKRASLSKKMTSKK